MTTQTTPSRDNKLDEDAVSSDGGELKPILDEALGEYEAKQDRGELRTIAHIVSDIGPETVVEIGTASGGSLFIWCKYISSTERIISIDKDHTKESMRICESMDSESEVLCFDALSQDDNLIYQVKDVVAPGGIDFLFIDGGSSYSEVIADYYNFIDNINDGGVVAFHDIRTHRNQPENVDVQQVWKEVRGDAKDYDEILSSSDAVEYGYGLMYF